jgi:hypothetical protein
MLLHLPPVPKGKIPSEVPSGQGEGQTRWSTVLAVVPPETLGWGREDRPEFSELPAGEELPAMFQTSIGMRAELGKPNQKERRLMTAAHRKYV